MKNKYMDLMSITNLLGSSWLIYLFTPSEEIACFKMCKLYVDWQYSGYAYQVNFAKVYSH